MLRQANVRGDQSPAAAATEGHQSQEGAQGQWCQSPSLHDLRGPGNADAAGVGRGGRGRSMQMDSERAGTGDQACGRGRGGQEDGRRRMSWGSPVVQAGDGVELRQQMRRGCGLRSRGR